VGQDAASKAQAATNTNVGGKAQRLTSFKMMRLTILLLAIGNQLFGQSTAGSDQQILFRQIISVDSIFFQALNTCDLKTYESFLTDDFEFYHDKGGLTKSRDAEMKSMTLFCGEQRQRQKLRRELIRESVEVNPIKDFGAVQTGRHRFFLVIDDKTEKLIEEAKFTNVWQRQSSGWKLSRVISYDHKPICNVQLSDNILDKYTGNYQMTPDRIILITKNQKLLRVEDGDWSADLYSESNSKFYLDHGNVQFEFVKRQKGNVGKLIIYENGTEIERGTRKD
jgi:ketosteroid isomerase-like protein